MGRCFLALLILVLGILGLGGIAFLIWWFIIREETPASETPVAASRASAIEIPLEPVPSTPEPEPEPVSVEPAPSSADVEAGITSEAGITPEAGIASEAGITSEKSITPEAGITPEKGIVPELGVPEEPVIEDVVSFSVASDAPDEEPIEAEEPEETAPLEPDPLKRIEGIGPKVAGLLEEAGILTFAQLAKAEIEQLQGILADAGLQFMKPDSWPQQAALAADEDWDGLAKLQDELKGGRRS
jgi:predicted flap endonuclease-1-like 5' DNA nuclease